MLRFVDYQGNFALLVPSDWRFDEDVAVENGAYTICFESKDGRSHLTVAVESILPPDFSIDAYVRKNIGTPESGFQAEPVEGSFNGQAAWLYSCRIGSGKDESLFEGAVFVSGAVLYSLSWSYPLAKSGIIGPLIERMKDSFVPTGKPGQKD